MCRKIVISMDLAPIGIATYSRLGHLKKTINALKANKLSSESILYVFSDAPKPGDEKVVANLRQYLRSVDGFKKVKLIFREVNNRPLNVYGGILHLLEKYGKCIYLEDDNLTAPGFLSFMNKALNFYEKDARVISIAGHTPPNLNLDDSFGFDYFSQKRFNPWGFGLWQDKFNKIKDQINIFNIEEIKSKLSNISFIKKLCETGINNYISVIHDIQNENNNHRDIRLTYIHTDKNLYSIYPKKSLVQNIGHDGTGVNSTVTSKFMHSSLWEKDDNFHFSTNINADEKVVKALFYFWFNFNTFTKPYIEDNIVKQIQSTQIESFSIVGIDQLTLSSVQNILRSVPHVELKSFIDLDSSLQSTFEDIPVYPIKSEYAFENKNYIIVNSDDEESIKNMIYVKRPDANVISARTICEELNFQEHCINNLIDFHYQDIDMFSKKWFS